MVLVACPMKPWYKYWDKWVDMASQIGDYVIATEDVDFYEMLKDHGVNVIKFDEPVYPANVQVLERHDFLERVTRGRNAIRDYFLKGKWEYLWFVDADVYIKSPKTDLDKMLEAIKDYDVVANSRTPFFIGFGFVLECCMIRRRVLENIKFRWEHGKCECACFLDDAVRSGYKVRIERIIEPGYLPKEVIK